MMDRQNVGIHMKYFDFFSHFLHVFRNEVEILAAFLL